MNQEFNEDIASQEDHEKFKTFKSDSGLRIKQDCFGTIVVTEVTSSKGAPCFGSQVLHDRYVDITIGTARLDRTSTRDWIYPDKSMINFRMTKNQWADFVSSFGKGEGTPITLQRIPDNYSTLKKCEEPIIENKFEFRNDIRNTEFKIISDSVKKLNEITSNSKLTKAEKEELRKGFIHLHNMLGSNAEFHRTVLQEDMEDVINDAKRTIEGYASQLGVLNSNPKLGFDKNNEISHLN